MKYQEMESYTTAKLAELLNDGWTLQWDDVSRGNKFTCWLAKGDKRMCFCAKGIGSYGCGPDRIEVYLFPVETGEYWIHEEDYEPIKTFYEIARPTQRAVDKPVGGWYVEDAARAEAICALRRERSSLRLKRVEKADIEPTERVVETFARVFGNERLKAKNLRIVREEHRGVWDRKATRRYRVEMLGRTGKVKDSRVYRLG